MKSIYAIIILFICINTFSQKASFDIQKKYTVTEVLQDIDYAEKYLIKFHPDPFRYITKDSLHAYVLRVKSTISVPLTEMQLRFRIKSITAKIGCGHTDVGASKAYTKAISKTNRPALPFNVIVVDTNRLFILNNLSSDTTIKPGDEILSIDNHSTNNIFKTIYSIYTTDGYNNTYKKQGIKHNWFKYYYGFCYGFHSTYTVQLKKTNGSVSNYTLNCIPSLKDTLILPNKTNPDCIYKTKTCNYSLLSDNAKIAVIDVDAFKGKGWRRFFRKTFKDINQKKIDHLVIDLRSNGGGEIMDGLNLLSYLIPETVTLPFDRRPNLLVLNPRFKMGAFSRITPFIFSTLMPQWPKHGRLRHYLIALPKKRKSYKGTIYVLINGKSFSMSGVAASYLKYKVNATIIGEETGGNVAGSNAVLSGKILLPNSRIQVFLPFYHIYHDIKVTNIGRGLMPDYPTHYTSEDLLNGVDVDLEKVLELVK